ncbi:MAG: translation initiation factor [Bacteroidota bacterium]
MSKKSKDKIGVVYSTDPNFNYQFNDESEHETLAPEKQLLYVSIDRKQRAGKSVTLIEGFVGSTEDLESLGKQLKNKCGCGGSVKEGMILIQGELKDKIFDLLIQMKYKVKKKG